MGPIYLKKMNEISQTTIDNDDDDDDDEDEEKDANKTRASKSSTRVLHGHYGNKEMMMIIDITKGKTDGPRYMWILSLQL